MSAAQSSTLRWQTALYAYDPCLWYYRSTAYAKLAYAPASRAGNGQCLLALVKIKMVFVIR